jgi:hypothetical protein
MATATKTRRATKRTTTKRAATKRAATKKAATKRAPAKRATTKKAATKKKPTVVRSAALKKAERQLTKTDPGKAVLEKAREVAGKIRRLNRININGLIMYTKKLHGFKAALDMLGMPEDMFYEWTHDELGWSRRRTNRMLELHVAFPKVSRDYAPYMNVEIMLEFCTTASHSAALKDAAERNRRFYYETISTFGAVSYSTFRFLLHEKGWLNRGYYKNSRDVWRLHSAELKCDITMSVPHGFSVEQVQTALLKAARDRQNLWLQRRGYDENKKEEKK